MGFHLNSGQTNIVEIPLGPLSGGMGRQWLSPSSSWSISSSELSSPERSRRFRGLLVSLLSTCSGFCSLPDVSAPRDWFKATCPSPIASASWSANSLKSFLIRYVASSGVETWSSTTVSILLTSSAQSASASSLSLFSVHESPSSGGLYFLPRIRNLSFIPEGALGSVRSLPPVESRSRFVGGVVELTGAPGRQPCGP